MPACEVMTQIALRLPALLIKKVDFVVRQAKAKAHREGLPNSFVNRSTIIREAVERGCGEILCQLGKAKAKPAKSSRTATRARNSAAKNPGRPR
jgi:hypothetical protein